MSAKLISFILKLRRQGYKIMPVEVKRKQNESTYSLLRRFQDKVKKSRAVILAKKRKHHEKPKTKRQTKKDALCRAEGRKKRAFLIKTGRLVEENGEMGRNKKLISKK